MLLNLSMRLEKILILSSILLIFIVACSSIDNINTADSCIIFEEKRSWYKSTKNSYTKWGTPISLQLAIINQESSFKQFAKPKRKRLLGLIPVVDHQQLLDMLRLLILHGIGIKIELETQMLLELTSKILLIL